MVAERLIPARQCTKTFPFEFLIESKRKEVINGDIIVAVLFLAQNNRFKLERKGFT